MRRSMVFRSVATWLVLSGNLALGLAASSEEPPPAAEPARAEAGAGPAAEAPEHSLAGRAHALWMSGKPDEAKRLLEEGLAARPQDAAAQFALARLRLYTCTGGAPPPDVSPALEAIEKAVEISPEEPRYRYWAGVIQTYRSIVRAHSPLTLPGAALDGQGSLAQLEKAVELKPDYHEARILLLGLYDRSPGTFGGSREKAEGHVRALEALDPVWGLRARCELRDALSDEEKLARCKEILERFPESAAAHELLGRELLRRGSPEAAERHLLEAIRLDPGRRPVLLALARAYLSRARGEAGGESESAANLEHAARICALFLDSRPEPLPPLRARALRQLSRVRERQGDTEAATRLRAEAERLDPVDFELTVSHEEFLR